MKKKYQNNKNCSLHSVRSAEYYKGYNSAVSDINKDDHSARAHTHTHTHPHMTSYSQDKHVHNAEPHPKIKIMFHLSFRKQY